MSGRGGIYRGPNGDKLHGDGREVNVPQVPDRVPILVVDSKDEAVVHLREMLKLADAQIARLEAEKQDAHTEGWNAAIIAAANTVGTLAERPYDNEPEFSAMLFAETVIRRLSKPTAAKSEGNRDVTP